MPFYLSDTFQQSLGKLHSNERGPVKTTAYDLQTEGIKPGDKFHRVETSKEPNFWSVRVNTDTRIIIQKTSEQHVLCYVDHHDKPYQWALNRKLETHPKTGALQLVVIPEVEPPKPVKSVKKPSKTPLAQATDEQLLAHGVPRECLEAVRAATEETLLDLQLPAEAMEALLQWVTEGKEPPLPEKSNGGGTGITHPDAKRRFRLIGTAGDLLQALNYPWEKWAVYLHPDQRKIVEADYPKPARVCGSAGTGKTVVALHRAFELARNNPDANLSLTTFSDALARALREKLKVLGERDSQVLERIDVHALDRQGTDLFKVRIGREQLANREQVVAAVRQAFKESPVLPYPFEFILNEWDHVLDAWQFETVDEYLKHPRTGTKKRLGPAQRNRLWAVAEKANQILASKGLVTKSAIYTRLARKLTPETSPFQFVVVDEAQDLSVAQLRFLASIGGNQKNRLFFAGDAGQQIFQRPFAWKDVGLDIRGRSKILKVNYRTSHEIRKQADRLLSSKISDAPLGEQENRQDVISVFKGPDPFIGTFKGWQDEAAGVANWIKERLAEGLKARELAVIVRGEGQFDRAKEAVTRAGQQVVVLDSGDRDIGDGVRLASMHLAKGLEFRGVVVMACDQNVIPDIARIEEMGVAADLDLILERERHLLYVACTRARDHLWLSGTKPVSEFLKDLETDLTNPN